MKVLLTNPDKEKREIVDIGKSTGIVPYQESMYNPNLTMDELSLLRSMIWENRENQDFIKIIHSWIFCGENPKKVQRFSDLIDAFYGDGIDVSFPLVDEKGNPL